VKRYQFCTNRNYSMEERKKKWFTFQW